MKYQNLDRRSYTFPNLLYCTWHVRYSSVSRLVISGPKYLIEGSGDAPNSRELPLMQEALIKGLPPTGIISGTTGSPFVYISGFVSP